MGTGLVGAPACGDVMRLQIKISDDGIIEDAKFKTFGCGSAIAVARSSPSGSRARRSTRPTQIKNTQIVEELAPAAGEDPLLGAGRGRHQGAIADYKRKRAARDAAPPVATAAESRAALDERP